jgi:NTE family protein
MALDEEPATLRELHHASDCLRACPAFAGVDGEALEALAAQAVQFCLPAGAVLFEAGSTPDGCFVIASGRLGIKPDDSTQWTALLGRGEVIGEIGWLLQEPRSAGAVALRDSELLWLPEAALAGIAAGCAGFALALARACARRLRGAGRGAAPSAGPRVFTVVPNGPEPVLEFACALVEELARSGRAELVWDVRASAHTAEWFNRLEEANDYVVYLADADATGRTRQCCRQADLVLLAADAHGDPRPWPDGVLEAAQRAGIPIELALLHRGSVTPGAAARWLAGSRAVSHHHIVDGADIGRLARLVTRRGVGLVLSGGGARGFAHLGVIRALREARIPIDFVGGASIGSIIAAGVANGWSDEEMRCRYRRSFVETNPVSDYTFPFVALTRGRKVTGLLRREFTEVRIEDLRVPFFCISASLSTGRAFEHREGPLWLALRASVAIPGVLPPVFLGDEVLVDGAAINNLPVDAMQRHAPGLVIGCDVGAERNLHCDFDPADQPPLWRFFSRSSRGRRRINIFQVLMRAGVINGASTAAAQRELADVLLKPPLDDVDLLNWRAFDRAIAAGYDYARVALDGESRLPRLSPAAAPLARPVSLAAEISRRLQAAALTVRGAPRPPAC